jgi:phage major head subunit gpT-like protein
MAFSKSSQLAAVNQTLITTYDEVFKAVQSNVGDLVVTQPVPEKKFVHAFVTGYPKMREWTGEKMPKSLKAEEIIGTAKAWESTIEIDVDDLLSPTLRPVLSGLENLGETAATHLDELIASFLQNGTSTSSEYVNFDGDPLFSTTHTNEDGVTNQSNNNTSQELTAANLIESYEQFMAYTDPLGRPLKNKPTHIIVPSALYLTAKTLVENPIDASGATNTMLGTLTVVHLPELDSEPTVWYLACVKGSSKPFINYELMAPELTVLNSPESENFFWKDKVVYGAVAKRCVKAGPWFLLQRNIQ